MTVIRLNHGKLTMVDDDTVRFVSQLNWHANLGSNGWDWYATATIRACGKRKEVSMARFIMDAPDGVLVDHVSGDTLDNRRKNLRYATQAENQHNQRRLRVDNTSGFKGVTFNKRKGLWTAQIYIATWHKTIGYFETAVEAARAYDEAAREHFGEFAAPNFEAAA